MRPWSSITAFPKSPFPTVNIHIGEWPGYCPRDDGVVVSLDSKGRDTREYCFINEHSGKEFRVRLVIAGFSTACIRELHLLFH